MINEIIDYAEKRGLHLGTADQCLLFAWTEYVELSTATADKKAEEAGDLLMMITLFAWRAGIEIPDGVFKTSLTNSDRIMIRHWLTSITEAWLNRSGPFVRNNPDRHTDDLKEQVYQLIYTLNTLYGATRVEKLAVADTLREKMQRKLGEIRGANVDYIIWGEEE